MSLVAIIPALNVAAANAQLQGVGFGPGNFSVPAYTGLAATHAALHAWDDAAFSAAVKGLAGVVWEESTGDPVARTLALITAQGAKWGAQSPELPASGTVTAGSLYRVGDSLWSVIQTFSRTTYPLAPETYPALIRRVRNPVVVEAWKQPIDQFDSYNLLNPFTGAADKCVHQGQTWKTTSNTNVWEPGVFGWESLGDPE